MTNRTETARQFTAKHSTTTSEKQHDQNFIRDFVGIFTDEEGWAATG